MTEVGPPADDPEYDYETYYRALLSQAGPRVVAALRKVLAETPEQS